MPVEAAVVDDDGVRSPQPFELFCDRLDRFPEVAEAEQLLPATRPREPAGLCQRADDAVLQQHTAAEAAVGLAIILSVFRNRETVNADELNLMRW